MTPREASMVFGILLGTTESFLPVIREMTPFGGGGGNLLQASQVPGECWLLFIHRNLGK